MSSSGAPRKIEGMKSMKVCVIAIAVIRIKKVVIGRFEMKAIERIEVEIKLIWIPGIRPVNVPAAIPIRNGIRKLNIFPNFVDDYLFFVFVCI